MRYLHPDQPPTTEWGRWLKKLIYVVALMGPLSAIPQIAEIWIQRQAGGVSLITWTLFLFIGVIWLLYGLSTRDTPLVLSNALWIVCDLVIMIGAIRFDTDLL